MRLLYASVVFLLATTNAIGQSFSLGPIPDWVVRETLPKESEVSKYDVSSGVYATLYDSQANFSRSTEYVHYGLKILTHSGVKQASEIYISYDTAYQKVVFHSLYVWRDGKKLDRTDEIEFETLRNEQSLQVGIYTGQVTAYSILHDVRKDDEIEYSYTIIGSNPIFGTQRFRLMPLEHANPIDHVTVRFLYPDTAKYTFDCNLCDNVSIQHSDTNGIHTVHVERTNVAAGDYEETTPVWYLPFAYFCISNTPNWKSVSDWATDIFDLKKEPVFNTELNEIISSDSSQQSKITAFINYVQDEIRYMGIESGIGSIKPFHPDQVLKQRFGDCKDKSLLLVKLLNSIGIERAYPVLVSSQLSHNVNNLPPSGKIFDHCIVYFEWNDSKFWVDPTIAMQGGNIMTIATPDYGQTIIVTKGVDTLTAMNITDKVSRTEIKEEFVLPDFKSPGTLKVVSKMYGMDADKYRYMLENLSTKDLSDALRGSYSRIYPNIIETEKIKIRDNESENVLTLIELYEISDIWKTDKDTVNGNRTFRYEPLNVYNYVNMMECETKKYPVAMNFPSEFFQTTIFSMPAPLEVGVASDSVKNDGFQFYWGMGQMTNSTVHLFYSYESVSREVSADHFGKVCSDFNRSVSDLPLSLYYPMNAEVKHILDFQPRKLSKRKKSRLFK